MEVNLIKIARKLATIKCKQKKNKNKETILKCGSQ